MTNLRGGTGLSLMFLSVLVLIFVRMQDITGLVLPVSATWFGLGGLFFGFVLTVTAANGWPRINKSADHSGPFRIRRPKKDKN